VALPLAVMVGTKSTAARGRDARAPISRASALCVVGLARSASVTSSPSVESPIARQNGTPAAAATYCAEDAADAAGDTVPVAGATLGCAARRTWLPAATP